MATADKFDRKQTEALLRQQPKYIPAGFAARAVLRSMPFAFGASTESGERAVELFAALCHVMLPPWAAGKWPAQGGRAANAATNAAYAAYAAYAAANAAYAATNAATNAAANAANAAANATTNAAAYAAYAANATNAAAYAANAAATNANNSDLNAIRAANGDAMLLQQMMSGPLWPDGTPSEFDDALADWRQAMLAEDDNWQVWFDWYQDRVDGKPALMERELVRATALSREDYDKGGAHMNRVVIAALAEFERNRTPTARRIEIEASSGSIVERDWDMVAVSPYEGLDHAAFFEAMRRKLDSYTRVITGPSAGNEVRIFSQLVEMFNELASNETDPGNWLANIESSLIQFEHLKDQNGMTTTPFPVDAMCRVLLDEQDAIRARYPDAGLAQDRRNARNTSPLDTQTMDAVQVLLDRLSEIVSIELRDHLDELLEAAKAMPVNPAPEIENQQLTPKQRHDIYSLKSILLAIRREIGRPVETLKKIFQGAEKASVLVKRLQTIAENTRALWEPVLRFLLKD